ncbi:transposase [Deinococcus misasensis]|uniref:transposase n=1 Tax=Deinococcus misasensis TaxID=392413 RepID=UPI00068DADDE|nr:transposase [Deinococcus misasensis]
MTQTRFDEDFKRQVLSEVLSGRKSISQVCREYGFTDQTFYNWRNRYLKTENVSSGPENRELDQLREENDRLRRMVGELSARMDQLQQTVKSLQIESRA